ncbi:MAG: hypothetical protein AB8G23_04905 [Myxococcota bacterium]
MAAKKSESTGSFSSTQVTLGHVFKVRPKVNTSFRPPDFARAKRSLSDETYESIQDAARAVAEEALSLTRGEATKASTGKRR